MRTVQPTITWNTLSFDNFYDVLLWIYREIPNYELAPDTQRAKLVFRGQRNAEWLLVTTAQRRLLNDSDVAANRASITRFVDSIRAEFPKKVLSTELEEQAVALHYGFATSLLDFTTDPEVAAYFAIDDAVAGTDGTIFLRDTTTLLRDGRVRFIKIPEYFPRPNLQSGLFIELAPDHDPSRLFTRLRFPHGAGLAHYADFRNAVGDIVPHDEIADLATNVNSWAEGASPRAAMPGRLGPALTVVEDAAHPEVLDYGTRLMAYAGIITILQPSSFGRTSSRRSCGAVRPARPISSQRSRCLARNYCFFQLQTQTPCGRSCSSRSHWRSFTRRSLVMNRTYSACVRPSSRGPCCSSALTVEHRARWPRGSPDACERGTAQRAWNSIRRPTSRSLGWTSVACRLNPNPACCRRWRRSKYWKAH